jgi:putative phage-type endonuclease
MTQQTDDDRERDEWLEQRRHGIGGSDAAAALGLSPWKTPLSLYLEKTGDARPFRDNESMLWGRVLEPAIRAEYTRRTGIACASGAQLTHPKYPWMRATLDGLSNERQPRVVEIKTARTDRGWGEPGTDDVPQTYLLQCVHYMVVTGAQLADIALLVGGQDFRIYTVQRNAALADLVVEGEHDFWQHVQRREPPEAKTLAEINMRYRQSQPGKWSCRRTRPTRARSSRQSAPKYWSAKRKPSNAKRSLNRSCLKRTPASWTAWWRARGAPPSRRRYSIKTTSSRNFLTCGSNTKPSAQGRGGFF